MATMRMPYYVWASLAVSCVAMLFGLDTGSIGPITTMPSFIDTFGHFSAVMHGVIVSSILIPSALTALVAGAFAHRFGQIRLVAIGSLIYATGAALECSAPVLGVFIFGRVVKGVGEGFFLSNVYVQVSEMSPAGIRGIMTAMPQFLITVGIVLGYFLCYGTSRLGSSSASWRVPLAIASGLGLLFSNCIWITPLSPRWLVAQGRIDEARIVLRKLGLDQSEQEELLAQAAISDAKLNGDATLWEVLRQTWVEFGYAFSKPYRGRTAFGCFIMGMQQWAGIDGVLYYAPILFQNAGLDGEQASFLASGASAIVILAVTIPATIFADRWGRRTASIFGGIGMTVLMTLIGTMYAADQVTGGSGVGKWVVIISIYLFAVVFSVTWALSFRTYLVESLPKQTRSSASSLAQCSNWLANYTVALTTPVLLAASSCAAYYIFAGCTLVCTVVVAFKMVETRGFSLEAIELQYVDKSARSSRDALSSIPADSSTQKPKEQVSVRVQEA